MRHQTIALGITTAILGLSCCILIVQGVRGVENKGRTRDGSDVLAGCLILVVLALCWW